MESVTEAVGVPDIAVNPLFKDNREALLHAILQASDNGILLSGLDRQDILANERLGELFHCAPQDLVLADPDDVRQIARAQVENPEQFDRILNETYANPMLSFEDELRLITEPERTLRRFTAPIQGNDGQPLGRLWTFLDISETKRLQAEVQSQFEKQTANFSLTRDALEMMNDLCGLSAQSMSPQALQQAIVRRVRPLAGYESAAMLIRSEDGSFSIIACRSDGELKHVTMWAEDSAYLTVLESLGERVKRISEQQSISPDPLNELLRSPFLRACQLKRENVIFGFLLFGGVLDQQALDCQSLYVMNAVVEQVALTLQANRLQTKLQAAQRNMMEAEKLRATGTLAASIAHDIRNILSTFQMEIAALPDAIAAPFSQQLSRFSTLTHRLLAFARPGKIDFCPTDIVKVIQQIAPLLQAQAHIHNVQIVECFPEEITLIAADASQLEHLFVNLCLNAIQSMADEGGKLTIVIETEPGGLKVSVSDTGHGIPPEVMEKLFEPFFTTRSTGCGLGLFSCKCIVEEHGGKLFVESGHSGQSIDPHGREGACFTVLFPIWPISV